MLGHGRTMLIISTPLLTTWLPTRHLVDTAQSTGNWGNREKEAVEPQNYSNPSLLVS
jgi:hypothetical protein